MERFNRPSQQGFGHFPRIGAPGSNLLAKAALFHAQRAAQRLAYRQRRNVLKRDTWLEDALSFAGPVE